MEQGGTEVSPGSDGEALHHAATVDGGGLRGAHEVTDRMEIAYQKAKRAYRRVVGKTMGALGPKKGEFRRLVEEHGEELVVKAVAVWAEEIGPERCRMLRWPVAVFLSQAEEFVEAARSSDESDGGWNTAETIVPESWRPGKAGVRG